MLMDAAKISEIIRMKKKKMLEADPELIDTSPTPDMNAQDVYDLEQTGRIQSTLETPPKINADDTMMDETYDGVGLSPEEKKRMGRLRSYMDTMDL